MHYAIGAGLRSCEASMPRRRLARCGLAGAGSEVVERYDRKRVCYGRSGCLASDLR